LKKSEGSYKPATPGLKPEGQKEERTCYLYSKKGHLARDCFHRNKPKLGAMMANKPLTSPKASQPAATSGFACKSHHKVNCEDCMYIPEVYKAHNCGALITTVDNELELKCGCFIPVLNACKGKMGEQQRSIMPVVTSYIGGKPVQVLRGTGCSTLVVRRSLVTDKQLTGETQLCLLIDGTAIKALFARIYIDTPFLQVMSEQSVCRNHYMILSSDIFLE